MDKKRALKWLLAFMGILLLAVAGVVAFFDPFYQYHGPLPGMDSVLYDRDNQVAGSVRNFEYEGVMMGSSTSENFDTNFLEKLHDIEFLKIARGGSGAADLLYYLNMGRENHDIKQVYWCMDVFAYTVPAEVSFAEDVYPMYLHSATVTDDIPYLFNKEVLFEKIPYSLACEMTGKHTDSLAYNWAADKTFGAAVTMSAYQKPAEPNKEKRKQDMDVYAEKAMEDVEFLQENLQLAIREIEAHPETEYTIIMPPYSMCWWDYAYVNDCAEDYHTVIRSVLSELLLYENVEIYFFLNREEIVCNLDNYMDLVHYTPEINQYMLECVKEERYRVTTDNLEDTIQSMRALYFYIVTEGIFEYYK